MKQVVLTSMLFGTLASSTIIGIAQADTFTQSAAVEIVEALAVSQSTPMNLGVVQRPASGTETASVSTGNVASGTIQYIDDSDVAAGVYAISGSSNHSISISAEDDGNVTGLEFTGLTGSYHSGSDTNLIGGGITGAAAPAGGKNLIVGATLTVASALSEGIYSPSFTLTVNYE